MDTSAPCPPDKDTLKNAIITVLKTVYDPEIPVNIYDLGLIYNVDIDDKYHAHVQMTLTTPGCPVAETFPGIVESTVRNVAGISDATVELVWDPPWSTEMMSEVAKLELGFL